MNKWIAGLGLTLALGACAQTWGPVPNSFLREAGAQVDTGEFGNATLNNTMIMNGEKNYVVSLANRFAEEVPSTITFAFDSAQLDSAARAALNRQGRLDPPVSPRCAFVSMAIPMRSASDAYNPPSSANVAPTRPWPYLVSRGINRRRLEAVVSYGERQPLIVTQGRERRNRRTVTEVSGFLKRHPTVVDGKYAQVI